MLHRSVQILAAVALGAAPASAAAVDESELDGQSANNTLASAQALAAALFTRETNADIFGLRPTATINGFGGLDDVDFYRFTMTQPGSAYFDIDGAAPGFDTYLAVFGADGTLLGEADDSSPADAGSGTSMDAFLGRLRLTAPGDYFVAVSHFGNFPTASFSGAGFFELSRPDGAFGGFGIAGATSGDASFDFSGPQEGLGYTLHITVPAPAGAIIVALAPARRRRRARR